MCINYYCIHPYKKIILGQEYLTRFNACNSPLLVYIYQPAIHHMLQCYRPGAYFDGKSQACEKPSVQGLAFGYGKSSKPVQVC